MEEKGKVNKQDGQALLHDAGMNLSELKDIMTHMNKEGITYLDIGEGTQHLRLKRKCHARSNLPASLDTGLKPQVQSTDEPNDAHEQLPKGQLVTSPVVGIFYDSPAPDQPPYVALGDLVKAGDILCIVEAMKLMNEVTSPVDGRIVEVLAERASRVEYGQTLFVIDDTVKGARKDDK